MSDQTRGITCPDMRRVVREALAAGWEWAGWSGTTHARIRWPATGAILSFGSTPSVASWKSLATDIKRVSGVEVWRKGNRKRSRKANELTGFSLSAAARERTSWHSENDADVTALHAEREDLIAECRAAARRGRRDDLLALPEKWRRIAAIEERLRCMAQPFQPFDPHSLADGKSA